MSDNNMPPIAIDVAAIKSLLGDLCWQIVLLRAEADVLRAAAPAPSKRRVVAKP